MREVDYLVVGQGIAGTMFSHFLLKQNKNILVMDQNDGFIPSLAAGAVINPVTGRKSDLAWRIDELLPFASHTYKEIEYLVGVSIGHPSPIHKYFSNPADSDAFKDKQPTIAHHAQPLVDLDENIAHPFGGIEITTAYYINPRNILPAWRKYLSGLGLFREENFDYAELVLTDSGATYKDIKAKQVVFCEGTKMKHNPWFAYLPLKTAKGEALIIEMDGLPQDHIVLKGQFLMPLGGNLFYVGATNEWIEDDRLPSEHKKQELVDGLAKMTNLPYKVISHLSGIRPTVRDRRPLLGKHPQFPQLATMNGMGTKGYSLAPWCAEMLVGHLEEGYPLDAEVDLKRFGLGN